MLREVTLIEATFTNWDPNWTNTGRCAFHQAHYWRGYTCSSRKTYACEKPLVSIPASRGHCDTAA